MRAHAAHRPTTALVAGLACMILLLGACSSSDDDADGGSGATTSTTAGAGKGGEFTLLTYNVAGLPQEVSQENPKEHLPLVSPLLEEYDVVLTQEDFDWFGDLAKDLDAVNYRDRLRKDTTHEFGSKPHPGPDAVDLAADRRELLNIGDGLGVLSRFEIEEDMARVPWTSCFGGFDTSDHGAADCLAMKGFSMTRMTLADGIEVDLYDLHLEAGGSDEDQRLQGEDVEQLADYIVEHSKGHAVILGGDTNLHTEPSHPDAEGQADTKLWQRFLERTGLTDACEATDCPEGGRIDKVAFRSDDGVELEAISYDVPAKRFRAPDGDDLSDHEPVVVGFRWSPA
jgi:hypothetical protein